MRDARRNQPISSPERPSEGEDGKPHKKGKVEVKATARQRKFIKALCHENDFLPHEVIEVALRGIGQEVIGAAVDDLNKEQAFRVLEYLKPWMKRIDWDRKEYKQNKLNAIREHMKRSALKRGR